MADKHYNVLEMKQSQFQNSDVKQYEDLHHIKRESKQDEGKYTYCIFLKRVKSPNNRHVLVQHIVV